MNGNNEPMLLELKTQPLGLRLTAAGKQYFIPLNSAAAQSLALALLSQPEVGGDVLPGVLEQYMAAQVKRSAKDNEFLKTLGVVSYV